MGAGELDGAPPSLGILESAFTVAFVRHGDGERVPRFDRAGIACLAERALELPARACAHAAGASDGRGGSPLGDTWASSMMTPPSTFKDPLRKPRRSRATRLNPAARTA